MTTVAIVGLGYVGLPLAVAFGRKFVTVGFDLSQKKVDSYRRGMDPTGEMESKELRSAKKLSFTVDPHTLHVADYIIVAVPTPIDSAHRPDFEPLVGASRMVGAHMKRGAIVIYESTVYPGATEEVCIPVLEEASGLRWKRDFHVGYSPERINPGDKEHTLERVIKVVSGDEESTLNKVARLYATIVKAGVHRVSSIQVAEAAKVIENIQRDLNIALMNELAVIFNRLGLDTTEVLKAAGSKWNFLSFHPGLVGGHCIGVDPYYLTYKADRLGYYPHVILAGRRINDGMGKYVAEQTLRQLMHLGRRIKNSTVNLLGLTFKENVPDLRNTRVVDIVAELQSCGVKVFVHDPVADPQDAYREYQIRLCTWEQLPRADAMIVAVAHEKFLKKTPSQLATKIKARGCFIDVKACFDAHQLKKRDIHVWRL